VIHNLRSQVYQLSISFLRCILSWQNHKASEPGKTSTTAYGPRCGSEKRMFDLPSFGANPPRNPFSCQIHNSFNKANSLQSVTINLQVQEGKISSSVPGLQKLCSTWYKAIGSLDPSKSPLIILHDGPDACYHHLTPLTDFTANPRHPNNLLRPNRRRSLHPSPLKKRRRRFLDRSALHLRTRQLNLSPRSTHPRLCSLRPPRRHAQRRLRRSTPPFAENDHLQQPCEHSAVASWY